MRNRGIIIGVAVGVAALTAAGILMSKRNKSQRNSDGAAQLSDTFRHKLNQLQRKAKKEYKNAAADGIDVDNIAKERANQWVSKSSANL